METHWCNYAFLEGPQLHYELLFLLLLLPLFFSPRGKHGDTPESAPRPHDPILGTVEPKLWNNLPFNIWMTTNLEPFESKLKMYLFNQHFNKNCTILVYNIMFIAPSHTSFHYEGAFRALLALDFTYANETGGTHSLIDLFIIIRLFVSLHVRLLLFSWWQ